MEIHEINDKLGLAKRLGIAHGWLYTINGDSPGIAEEVAECAGVVLGEIGRDNAEDIAAKLADIRRH